MEDFLIPVLFGLVLFFAHLFSESIAEKHKKHKMKTISFTAGIFITYIFLHLLPQLFQNNQVSTHISLLFVLFGFSVFHIIGHHAYHHKLKTEKAEEHFIGLFIYHFVVGTVLVSVAKISLLQGILFFIPILIFTSLSSISMNDVHKIEKKSIVIKMVFSLSTLFGILLSLLYDQVNALQFVFLGFITGSLFYIIFSDALPKENEGKPFYFALGVIVYSLFISLGWLL
jgi:hypothetical protein